MPKSTILPSLVYCYNQMIIYYIATWTQTLKYMAHIQSRDELIDHLNEQIEFLKTSASLYDTGIHAESKRIAHTLRVLLHDGLYPSLFTLLDIKNKLVYKSLHELNTPGQEGKVVFRSHTGLEVSPSGTAVFMPLREPLYDLTFDEWWGQDFVIEGGTLTRSNVVLKLANKDGGAHVSQEVSGDYARITRDNPGWQIIVSKSDGAVEDFQIEDFPVLRAARIIAHEFIYSLNFEDQLNALLGTRIKFEKTIRYEIIPKWENRIQYFENVDDASPLSLGNLDELRVEPPLTLDNGSLMTVDAFLNIIMDKVFYENITKIQKSKNFTLDLFSR